MTTTKKLMEQAGLDPDEQMLIRSIALHCAATRLSGGFGVNGGRMETLIKDTVTMAEQFEVYLLGGEYEST